MYGFLGGAGDVGMLDGLSHADRAAYGYATTTAAFTPAQCERQTIFDVVAQMKAAQDAADAASLFGKYTPQEKPSIPRKKLLLLLT